MSKELCIHGVSLDIPCIICSLPFADFYITPRKHKPREFSQEEYDEDIAFFKNMLFKALNVPKEYLKENEELLPCGHPVTDDYAYNDPNPGATHFCVSCAKESEE